MKPLHKLFLFLMLAIFPSLSYSQAKPPAKNDDDVRFVSLEEYEKRSQILKIREKLLDELNAANNRKVLVRTLDAEAASIARETDSDKKITAYLNLRDKACIAIAEVRDANIRQVEIAGLLDITMAAGGLLPQVSTYINEARTQLRSLGIEQEDTIKKLEHFIGMLNVAVRSVPPPVSFKNASGIEMKLVSAGTASFYISTKPVNTVPGVSYTEAEKLTQEISHREGAFYVMPGMREVKVLAQYKLIPSIPIWTSAPWQPQTPEDERMLKRFGVTMLSIWDPGRSLKRDTVFGELPFAKYDNLGFYVVTPTSTGWQFRWNKIIASFAKDTKK